MSVYVLDTPALLGLPLGQLRGRLVTVKEVIDEAQSPELRAKVEAALASGRVRIQEPTAESVRKVRDGARATGDRISRTDAKVLALALDLAESDPVILTDDYAVQNLASKFGIRWRGVRAPGIARVVEWGYRCSGCGREVRKSSGRCPVCGAELKREERRSRNLDPAGPNQAFK